jgi:hypothetical protein
VTRAIYLALGVLAVLCFIATVGVAVASSIAPALARGPAHAHAIGWAAVLLGVAFLCGATRSAWNGYMDLDNPYVRRSTVRFTAADDPGPFFGYLLFFYGFGIAAILFGVYRLRH